VFGVQVVMRVYAEETSERSEPLLAGALDRSTYLASNATVAFLGPTIVYVIGATAIAVIAQTSQTSSFGDVIGQTLATVAAIWVLVALAPAAVGARPAVRAVGWLGVVASFALTLLGPTFRLPNWALGISPLHHVPNVTAHSRDWTGLIALIAVAAGLTIIAFTGYRRRDIAAA
jgi:ABC-2 type transport system permease protein